MITDYFNIVPTGQPGAIHFNGQSYRLDESRGTDLLEFLIDNPLAKLVESLNTSLAEKIDCIKKLENHLKETKEKVESLQEHLSKVEGV